MDIDNTKGYPQPKNKTYIESTFYSSTAAKSLRQFSMAIYRIDESPNCIWKPAILSNYKSERKDIIKENI